MELFKTSTEPLFHEESYKKHSEWYNLHFPTEESKLRYLKKNNPHEKTIGNWLQQILFSCLDPLLVTEKQNWLTVGDAYGFDARYILSKPNQKVVATDLNSDFLKTAKLVGLITEYASENAEKLSFDDNVFDFVLCKETYHHFPRPYSALYEMIRVAKKGIVIIEPQDPISKMPLLLWLINMISRFNPALIKKVWKNQFSYEPVGNYIYKVSEREFEKFAAGLGLKMVAFKQVNPNFYKIDNENIDANFSQKKYRNILFKKNILDFMVKYGILPGQVLSSIIFKEKPTDVELERLKNSGYKIISIPENPYK